MKNPLQMFYLQIPEELGVQPTQSFYKTFVIIVNLFLKNKLLIAEKKATLWVGVTRAPGYNGYSNSLLGRKLDGGQVFSAWSACGSGVKRAGGRLSFPQEDNHVES